VGDRVVGVGKDNLIYALSNRKARVLWKVRLPADPSTSPAVQGNQILVGARDRRVYRLAVRDGTIKSSFPVDGIPVGRPLVAGKLAFFILDSDEGKHGLVTALGLEGAVWSATLQSAQSSEQPFEWNGTVVVGDCGGTMTALQTETGATAWSLKLEGCIRAIGGDSRSLYAGVQEGTVFALQP
jgi:outer membrane protein assembly factor BamB